MKTLFCKMILDILLNFYILINIKNINKKIKFFIFNVLKDLARFMFIPLN